MYVFGFRFPFYYEIKIIVVLWLLSPATRGSSILYRKFVHPTLTKREKVGCHCLPLSYMVFWGKFLGFIKIMNFPLQEIDEAIMHAKAQGYSTILRLGARGVDYAKYVIMQTAIKVSFLENSCRSEAPFSLFSPCLACLIQWGKTACNNIIQLESSTLTHLLLQKSHLITFLLLLSPLE